MRANPGEMSPAFYIRSGPARSGGAQVKVKLRCLESAEVGIFHVCDMFAHRANVFVPDGPRQRQVRRVRTIFPGHTQRRQRLVSPPRQRSAPDRPALPRRASSGCADWAGIRNARSSPRNPVGDVSLFSARFSSARRSSGHAPMNLLVMCRFSTGDQFSGASGRSRPTPVRGFQSREDPGEAREQPHRRLFWHVMARVRVIHWKPAESGPLIEACKACGYEVEFDDIPFPALAKGSVIISPTRS